MEVKGVCRRAAGHIMRGRCTFANEAEGAATAGDALKPDQPPARPAWHRRSKVGRRWRRRIVTIPPIVSTRGSAAFLCNCFPRTTPTPPPPHSPSPHSHLFTTLRTTPRTTEQLERVAGWVGRGWNAPQNAPHQLPEHRRAVAHRSDTSCATLSSLAQRHHSVSARRAARAHFPLLASLRLTRDRCRRPHSSKVLAR